MPSLPLGEKNLTNKSFARKIPQTARVHSNTDTKQAPLTQRTPRSSSNDIDTLLQAKWKSKGLHTEIRIREWIKDAKEMLRNHVLVQKCVHLLEELKTDIKGYEQVFDLLQHIFAEAIFSDVHTVISDFASKNIVSRVPFFQKYQDEKHLL